ncbi:hypothetical protein GCM10010191_71730 [Actinomadura vinacea]|uniref:Uncharacterized protein n=1 Tax=Actinomadura vinacea TaxID=115336 RepID=A0ABN3JZY7_9ACTN
MDNAKRGTLFLVLLVVNVSASVVADGTWYQIVIGALTGAGMLALAVDYLVRGRRKE